jgi:TfoX/Sxy family transcriptional regulator of competence genes
MDEATSGLDFVQKRMFGGSGYFAAHGGIFAAIVTHDDLVLKFPMGEERDALILLGGKPWVYDGQGKAMTMQEWIVVPEAFYDDVELLRAWTLRAYRGAPMKRPKDSSAKAGLAKSSAAKSTVAKSSAVKVTVSKPVAKKSSAVKTSVTKRSATKTGVTKRSTTAASGGPKAKPERTAKSKGTTAPPRRKGAS